MWFVFRPYDDKASVIELSLRKNGSKFWVASRGEIAPTFLLHPHFSSVFSSVPPFPNFPFPHLSLFKIRRNLMSKHYVTCQ